MRMSEMEILKGLLFEIDKICQNHNLHYTLVGEFARCIAEEQTLPEAFDHISIAMTMGDIERLAQIVNEKDDGIRQVEYILNNPYANGLGVRYYSSDTTFINLREFGTHVNYGFFINIIPIVKVRGGKKARLLNFMTKAWGTNSRSLRLYSGKEVISAIFFKAVVRLIGRERARKKIYQYYRSLQYIDRWENISNCTKVKIGKTKFKQDSSWELQKIDVSERRLSIAKCVLNMKGNKELLKNPAKHVIGLEFIPFRVALENNNLNEELHQIQKMREKYLRAIRKTKNATRYINQSWDIYLMIHDVLRLRRIYDKASLLQLKDALLANDYTTYEKEIQPYLQVKLHWRKKKVPFLEIPELEKIMALEKDYL